VIGILFGVLSFASGESNRVAVAAVAFGASGIAFQFFAMYVMALLFIALLAVVISSMGGLG